MVDDAACDMSAYVGQSDDVVDDVASVVDDDVPLLTWLEC